MPIVDAPKMSYSFDDVLIEPNYSEKMGSEVSVQSQLTAQIGLNIPILSSAMDTVTESKLAIAIAQQLSLIHI